MEKGVELYEKSSFRVKAEFVSYSLLGVFIFFVPITVGGIKTIPLDHIVGGITRNFASIVPYTSFLIIVVGGILPFINKNWNKDITNIIFSFFRVSAIFVSFMALSGKGPDILMERDMIPFLYDKLAISLGLIIPLGAIFLSFLVGYGLLEFIGVIMEPIMKPIWKTPGRSAIDAVASFVGSYSIGLLITNRVFKENKYTIREACIIATGFSTVSATFMIIVAKTLGLMEIWNFYFWSTLGITFLVTAITVRLYPLATKPDLYNNRELPKEIEKREKGLLKEAIREGLEGASNGRPLMTNIKDNFLEGLKMASGVLPTVLSIGLFGLLLAKYTPVFDIIAYIFYPFTLLMKIPEPMLAAKASSVEIAEMFLPALLAKGAPLITRYVVGVVSISAILFFSALIPCILSTEIPLKIRDMLVIWIERTILSIVIAGAVAHLFL